MPCLSLKSYFKHNFQNVFLVVLKSMKNIALKNVASSEFEATFWSILSSILSSTFKSKPNVCFTRKVWLKISA